MLGGSSTTAATSPTPAGYASLAELLDKIDEERGTRGNRLYYLATQPSAFAEIVAQLGRAGLDHERHEGGWRRVVIEKPFGRDLDSAVRLNREVGKVFRERQVYRIDHYLGKETVRNLLVFRFANGIFEPIWNRRHIDHVQITVAESIGIESRGAFYEETGASRDFLQNHLLQLLSLVAMEPPATFDADALRDEKVKVLRAIPELTRDQVQRDVVRGQYGPGWVTAKPVMGYRSEPEVDPQSETETYIAARLTIDDWRWSDVPFYLRMGKRLPKRSTEIAIQFKEVPHRLFKDSATDPEANLLAMRIQPDEGIMLRFGAKVPGLGIDVRNVTMDFTYGSAFQTDSPDAYETLILDALLGDASLFTRADEVEEAWSIVDPILDTWADDPAPPTSRTTTPAPGGPRPPTTCWPARADGGAGSERRRGQGGAATDGAAGRPGQAVVRRGDRGRDAAGGRRADRAGRAAQAGRADAALDVEGAVDRGDRARAGPDLGRAQPRDRRRRRGRRGRRPGGRHIAARTSVMNLVVVARQPELGERSAETISRLTGRHPSRTLIIQGADPDGPPWIDARIQAHCVMPRAGRARDVHGADLPDGRRRDRSAPVRPRRAAADPRPARHRLVARRARSCSRSPCATCSARPTASSSMRRAGRATAWIAWSSWAACTTTSTGCRSATSPSSGSRAGARRSRPCSTTRTSCRSCTASAGSR